MIEWVSLVVVIACAMAVVVVFESLRLFRRLDRSSQAECKWVQDEDNLALWWTDCDRFLDEKFVQPGESSDERCRFCQRPKRRVRVTP